MLWKYRKCITFLFLLKIEKSKHILESVYVVLNLAFSGLFPANESHILSSKEVNFVGVETGDQPLKLMFLVLYDAVVDKNAFVESLLERHDDGGGEVGVWNSWEILMIEK